MPTEGQQSPPRHLGSSCRTRRADGVLSRQIRSTTAGREVMDPVFTASMLGDSLMLNTNTNHVTAAYILPDAKSLRH